jgi:hypothetical protein
MLFHFAVRKYSGQQALRPRMIRFEYLAKTAREFIESLADNRLIVGPLSSAQGEYWLLGQEFTGVSIEPAVSRADFFLPLVSYPISPCCLPIQLDPALTRLALQ